MNRREMVMTSVIGAMGGATTLTSPIAAQTPDQNETLEGLSFNDIVYLGVFSTWVDMLDASKDAFRPDG
jgi:uncharacterized hydantoinase/oxoprolinase family protein